MVKISFPRLMTQGIAETISATTTKRRDGGSRHGREGRVLVDHASSSLSSSTTTTTTSGGDGGGGESSGLNLPLMIGAAAAVVIFFSIIVLVCVCGKRERKNRTRDGLNYYTDPSSGSSRHPKGRRIYYKNGPSAPWRPSLDRITKQQPPPGTTTTMSGPWRAPPPPPPPPSFLLYTSSSDMSTDIFSAPHATPLPPPSPMVAPAGFNNSVFNYEELAEATDGFSHANLIGQGGFGYVHKGILPNGKQVAVKSLKAGSGQGEREFQAEVEIISRVHHRHLVSLVGYCIAGRQRLLVYDFVPNQTLEFHLHSSRDHPIMDFPTRIKIALGAAKGIAYLHEDCHPRIIHRDIKAANILLDYNFEAMVADFGLAKPYTDNNTHISTRVMGTFGYLAPEYASSGKLTEKSDVFSFGVMLLELITGRRPADTTRSMMEDTLVDWARPLLTRAVSEGIFDGLVDPQIEGNFNPNEMIRMVACAAACIRTSKRRRPKMTQIVRVLECETSIEDINEVLLKPGLNPVVSFDSSEDSSSQKSLPRRF